MFGNSLMVARLRRSRATPAVRKDGRRSLRWALALAALVVVYFLVSAAHAQTPARHPTLGEIDANSDGAITRAEAAAARAALFVRLDADADGYLSESERTVGGARLRVEGEADSDHRISHDEFMNQPYRMFEHMDADHNGVLSAAELQAAQAAQATQAAH